MHGNEVVSRVVLLALIDALCSNYGNELLLTLLVQQTRIHIMPTMNPDGYELAYRRKCECSERRRVCSVFDAAQKNNVHNYIVLNQL